MSELMLDVGQANELKLAFRIARGSDGSEWTNGYIKVLTDNPSFLGQVLDFVRGRAEIVIKKMEEKVIIPTLTLTKSIATNPVVTKKTADCFTNRKRYTYRDSDLDNWLPKNQKEQMGANFLVQELNQQATFLQAVQEYLGMQGDVATLSQQLKIRNCITTLPTIESLIGQQEIGGDVGLRTDGYTNFFFVEDKDGSVSVVFALRFGGRWDVRVFRLDFGLLWIVGCRFFFRN